MSPFKLIDDLRRDAMHALRAFTRQPGFASLVVLTLALGIGATTAIYSAIDAAFFRPLPFPRAEELVRLTGLQLPIDIPRTDATPQRKFMLDLADLEGVRDVFPATAAYATGSRNLESGPEPRRVEVTFVTEELFAVLGRDAALGRVFTRDEDVAWQREGRRVVRSTLAQPVRRRPRSHRGARSRSTTKHMKSSA